MSLNITLDDVNRGRYEVQKNQLIRKLARKRAVIGGSGSSLPSHIVRSELLEFMAQECGRSGVFVVKADRGLGKSTAGIIILKHSAGGIMFRNCITTSSEFYWKGVASAIGIPKGVYENSSNWQNLLVGAIAGATSPEEPISWIDRIMELSLSFCSGVDQDPPDDPPEVKGLDLSLLRKKPVMIFDDFDNVPEKDIDLFMRSLYPVVKDRGVLLFVMVRDERTASKLLGLNNWGRIAPLPKICEDISGPKDEDRVPKWRSVKWTKAQLEAIVRSNFGEIPSDMPPIVDGANPLDVLDEAEKRAILRLNKVQ